MQIRKSIHYNIFGFVHNKLPQRLSIELPQASWQILIIRRVVPLMQWAVAITDFFAIARPSRRKQSRGAENPITEWIIKMWNFLHI